MESPSSPPRSFKPLIAGAMLFGAGFLSGVVFMAYQARTFPLPGAGKPSESDQLNKMASALKDATEKEPDSPGPWIQLGNMYFDHDQPSGAIDAYQRALALEPKNADVWTDLGVMYRRTGEPDKSVDAFDRAILMDPSHLIARFNKGIVLMHDLNDAKGALGTWKTLLDLDPLYTAPNGQPLEDIIKSYEKHESAEGKTPLKPTDEERKK